MEKTNKELKKYWTDVAAGRIKIEKKSKIKLNQIGGKKNSK